MTTKVIKSIRRLNIATHRDLGYFFSSLIIVYCLSGIALNHINDWNPDFIIQKQLIQIPRNFHPGNLTPEVVAGFSSLVGETRHKVYDIPSPDRVKIYYDNATLLIDFTTGVGEYERISRRPLFYESNLLHRNSVAGWRWASDIFAVMLIIISITGLFILKGKHGLGGRGKWWVLAGITPPALVLVIHALN